MSELKFSTGVVSFKVNGAYELRFNPADILFAEQLFSTFEELARRHEEVDEALKSGNDPKAVFDAARNLDAEIRAKINALFGGEDVCTGIFGSMSPTALGDGFPVWANLLLAVMEQLDTTIIDQQKRTAARIEKYTAKYKKKK